MQIVQHMYRAVEFIEHNLRNPLAVKTVSDAVNSSVYHFTRTFSDIVGHSPYDYIMRRRLSEAALELTRGDKKIIDIAFDYQFNSPETFSRAFKKMFGLLPNEARKLEYFEPVGFKTPVEYDYLVFINDRRPGNPEMEQKGEMYLSGVPFKLNQSVEHNKKMLKEFQKELFFLGKQVHIQGFYLVTVYPHFEDEYSIYHVLAVKTAVRLYTPGYLTGKLFPSQTYAKFSHSGGGRQLRMTLDYIFQTWAPKSGHAQGQSIVVQNLGHDYAGLISGNWDSEILVPLG